MCTPIGHALAGVTLGLAVSRRGPWLSPWRDLAFCALVSQAPDLDFVPGLIMGMVEEYHHGISHSVGFALLGGLICAALGWRRGLGYRWGLLGALLYLAHVLLDYTTVSPRGIPLWWPFSEARLLADNPFFIDVWRRPLGWSLVWHNLGAVALEAAVLGPPAALMLWLRRRWFRGPAVSQVG
ncbi:MAG: metal-dependent hydrolase [Desulfarculus sp.]|nr:metal-dependent hydrolase [Desulfarculus sp.]